MIINLLKKNFYIKNFALNIVLKISNGNPVLALMAVLPIIDNIINIF